MKGVPLTVVTGPALPLLMPNIDTDVIIRIERMANPEPDLLGTYAFESLRFLPDGTDDPTFPGNDPRWRGAPILLGGTNFGCGSSREPAVLAVMGMGVRCVIAPSYGDIFVGNCHQNGVLPVVLPEAEVLALAARCSDGRDVTVDLAAQTVSCDGEAWHFAIGAAQKQALLQGLDDLDLALLHTDAIAAWQARDRVARPWAWASAS